VGLLWNSSATFAWDSLHFGRVGGGRAESNSPHSAFLNPALLGSQTSASVGISTFRTQSNQLSPSEETGSQAHAFSRWAISFEQPIGLKVAERKWGLGFSLSAPFEKVATIQATRTNDWVIPQHGTRDQQLKGSAGLGIELIPDTLFLGTSVSLFLNSLGSAEAVLSERPSSRMNVDVGLQASPIVGLYSRQSSFSTALVFRDKIDPLLDQTMTAKVQVNEQDAFEQPFLLKSYLYFEPKTLDWDLQWNSALLSPSIGFSYEWWGEYQAPTLITETYSSSGETFRTENLRAFSKNTLNPRASFSWKAAQNSQINMGYQFRPTPFEETENRESSLPILDSQTHVLGLSLIQRFSKESAVGLGAPLELGVFTQWHQITRRSFKNRPEAGRESSSFSFGGDQWIFGISAKLG